MKVSMTCPASALLLFHRLVDAHHVDRPAGQTLTLGERFGRRGQSPEQDCLRNRHFHGIAIFIDNYRFNLRR